MRGKRLTDEQALAIFWEGHRGIPQKVTAKRFDVSQGHVCNIQRGKVFGHLLGILCDASVVNATLATLAFVGAA